MNYKMDVQKISSDLQKAISNSQDVNEILNKLKNEIDILGGTWNDGSYTTFKSNFLKFLEEVKNLNEVYSKTAYTSKGIAEDFKDADSKDYTVVNVRREVTLNE